jgi:hypothetical protein
MTGRMGLNGAQRPDDDWDQSGLIGYQPLQLKRDYLYYIGLYSYEMVNQSKATLLQAATRPLLRSCTEELCPMEDCSALF